MVLYERKVNLILGIFAIRISSRLDCLQFTTARRHHIIKAIKHFGKRCIPQIAQKQF